MRKTEILESIWALEQCLGNCADGDNYLITFRSTPMVRGFYLVPIRPSRWLINDGEYLGADISEAKANIARTLHPVAVA